MIKINRIYRKKPFLLLPLFWILLWLLPWTHWLNSLPWIRLGISLIIFSTPGVIISLFLAGEKLSLLTHLISGLAFSVLFVGILGMLGRVFHVPFEYVKVFFALTGLIVLLVFAIKYRIKDHLFKPSHLSITTLILLLLMIAFGIIINFLSRTTGDDQTYLAYLTSWQHAQPLNFQEVYFASGNADSIRFWLSVFPMSLALLAEISGLHGLMLIGLYLEPFLIIIAILATYDLYEDLLQSEQQAILAVLLQFTFLFLLRGYQQPGLTFFNRLSEDKVFAAFILFPIFFLALRLFLEYFTLQSSIFVLLAGLSLAITHPVILAYSVFIVGLYAGIVTFIGKNYKKFLVVVILLTVIILPPALLRFINVPSASSITYDLESALDAGAGIETRISYLAGTPFYGFNLDRIKILPEDNAPENLLRAFLTKSYLWTLGLGFLWSLFNIKRKTVAPFIAASSSLILLSAIPYTGWIIGYFVSARMLWRTPWLLPIGLISLVLFHEFILFIWRKIPANILPKIPVERVVYTAILGTCSIVLIFFSVHVYIAEWKTLAERGTYINTLENLSALGNYLEANIDQPSMFIAAPQSSEFLSGLFTQSLMDYLPGLSSKSKVAYFREYYSAPNLVDMEKVNLIFSLDTAITPAQRIDILRTNRIQYVLIDNPSLMNYYASYPQFFDVQKAENYWMFSIHKIVP
jgi:hypothetical protein